MSRAISRDSFNELKNYLGVYMQQGRVMLDADWNENQDINLSFLRQLTRDTLGDGTPNNGFAIRPVFLPGNDPSLLAPFAPLVFFFNHSGVPLENFESLEGFSISQGEGRLGLGAGLPYEGAHFLRVSGHSGQFEIVRTLPGQQVKDLSGSELAVFHFRVSQPTQSTITFFLEDDKKNRSLWRNSDTAFARDLWLPGFAVPLDLGFHIVTPHLPPAVKGQPYRRLLWPFGGNQDKPMDWNIVDGEGEPPKGLTLSSPDGPEAVLQGTPEEAGDFAFTVVLEDSDGLQTKRRFTLTVKASGRPPDLSPPDPDFPIMFQPLTAVSGSAPADLTRIKKYGFEIEQRTTRPVLWDFDDLRLGNDQLMRTVGANNFVIRTPFSEFLTSQTIQLARFPSDEFFQVIVEQLEQLQLADDSLAKAGRFYVGGLPCVQCQDLLFSDQADPNAPPLSQPPAGSIPRRDAVYLDVWTEPVTYVEDPQLREVALEGPDTTTRLVVRHRVRVAQGSTTPTGNGLGRGRLSTTGTYSGRANRLYCVEIDSPGDLGTATFRWSDDNASTIQRVIEPVASGTKQVVVEDASAFRPGDAVLIRRGEEYVENLISSMTSNVIELQNPVGPASPGISTPAREMTCSRPLNLPRLQRWNAFHVPIVSDPDDRSFSTAIDLNDGVKVRFGGDDFRQGDTWAFTTRYLPDELRGTSSADRIEPLHHVRPNGVVHQFSELAVLTRDGDAPEPEQVLEIEDRCKRVGVATLLVGAVGPVPAAEPPDGLPADTIFPLARLRLLPGAAGSIYIAQFVGVASIEEGEGDGVLNFTFTFLAAAGPDTDNIHIAGRTLHLRRGTSSLPLRVPFEMTVVLPARKPSLRIPTTLQVDVERTSPQFIGLLGMQLTVLELKQSTAEREVSFLPRE